MNTREVAQILDGNQMGDELEGLTEEMLKENGLVVLFGYSDDNVELRGAINDEVGVIDGSVLYIYNGEVLGDGDCDCDHGDACPYETVKRKAGTIDVLWARDDEEFTWVFKTAMAHHTFTIMEDEEKFCKGIVFSVRAAPTYIEYPELHDGLLEAIKDGDAAEIVIENLILDDGDEAQITMRITRDTDEFLNLD